MSIIQTIQNKSRGQKIALMWTVSITILVLLISLWVVSAHFQKNTKSDTSIFQTIGQGFSSLKK